MSGGKIPSEKSNIKLGEVSKFDFTLYKGQHAPSHIGELHPHCKDMGMPCEGLGTTE